MRAKTLALCALGTAAAVFLPATAGIEPAPAELESLLSEGLNGLHRGNYREAIAALEKVIASRAWVPGPVRTEAMGQLAMLYELAGRYVDEELVLRAALSDAPKEGPSGVADTAERELRLSGALRAQGRYREAEALLGATLERLQAEHGIDHPFSAEALIGLAELAYLQGRHAEAERLYWRAYMVNAYLYGSESSAAGEALLGVALALRAQGRASDARQPLAKAAAIAEKPPRSDPKWDRLDERDLRQSLPYEREHFAVRGKIFTNSRKEEHPAYAEYFQRRADVYFAQRRDAEAEHYYRRSIALRERAFGREHPEIALANVQLAAIYARTGFGTKAAETLRAALRVFEKRIAAHASGPQERAMGERNRWRPAFLVALSLFGEDPAWTAEAFTAIQYVQSTGAILPGAGSGKAPLAVPEVQKLLAPRSSLAVWVRDEESTYLAIVSRERAQILRLAGAESVTDALKDRLTGMSRIFTVGEGAIGLAHVPLPSIDALRDAQGR